MRIFLASLTAFAALSIITFSAGSAAAFTPLASCEPTWPDLPVRYYINRNGTNRISSMASIESAIQTSFDVWEEPCCSRFRASYEGQTTDTALNNDKDVVLSFSDDNWPSGLGGPDVIGIALVEINAQCDIISAPILFNSFNWAFDLTGQDVDLQAVATHEVGHLLGLGHSRNVEATMFAEYVGGTGMRTLHDVDADGVCHYYDRDCDCTDDEECRENQICSSGNCVRAPCEDDAECGAGRICEDTLCIIPPCDDDGDCDEGFLCENDRCFNACPACRLCEDHDDCGAYGYCHPFEHGGRCMIACGNEDRCPGDSECTVVAQGNEDFSYCIAPDAEDKDYCPEEYICEGGDDLNPCPGLGNDCRPDTYDCTAENDRCLERADDTNICTCSCLTDTDCGFGSRCIPVEDGRVCIPERTNPCENVDCASFERCYDGRCVDPQPRVTRGADDTGCFGCSAASNSPDSGVLLGLFFLAAFLIRRRRRNNAPCQRCL